MPGSSATTIKTTNIMKRFLFLLKRLWNGFISFLKRLIHRKTRFEKLLSTYKETKMDITTLTQLIEAFRAETQQNAITPDSLGQLLQKIVNLLGDAADSSTMQTLTTWMNNLTGSQSLVKNIRATTDKESFTLYMDKVNATTGSASIQSLRILYPKYTLARGNANGYVQLSLTDDTGSHEYSTIKIYGASTTAAGIMTAEDKRKLDNTASGLNSLANEVALKATKHEVEQITEWEDKVKSVGNVVKSVAVSQDSEKMYLRLQKGSLETGQTTADNILVPHVTEERAGVMSAEDYQTLNTLSERVEELEEQQDVPQEDKHPYYHIEVEPEGDEIFLKYSRELTRKGYVPYIFRWTVKRSTHKRMEAPKSERVRTQKRRGWHLFYGMDKVQFSSTNDSKLLFLTNTSNLDTGDAIYHFSIRWLLGTIRYENNLYKVGFGHKTYKISKNHRFKFGVAFAPPQVEGQEGLSPYSLVSNIAPFNIMFVVDERNHTYHIHPSV